MFESNSVTDIIVTKTCLITALDQPFEEGGYYQKVEEGVTFSASSNKIYTYKSGLHWKFNLFGMTAQEPPFWVVIPKDSVKLKTYVPKELDLDRERDIEEAIPGYTEFLKGVAKAIKDGVSPPQGKIEP